MTAEGVVRIGDMPFDGRLSREEDEHVPGRLSLRVRSYYWREAVLPLMVHDNHGPMTAAVTGSTRVTTEAVVTLMPVSPAKNRV